MTAFLYQPVLTLIGPPFPACSYAVTDSTIGRSCFLRLMTPGMLYTPFEILS